MTLGARLLEGGATRFEVWAPFHDRVVLALLDGGERRVEMAPLGGGDHGVTVPDAPPGARYGYVLGDDAAWTPDPASRWQPDGVHGPSAVVDHRYSWTDAGFRPPAPSDLVLYELHVGTFTSAGTFAAVVPHLAALVDLGVTAVELMPVAQFPGARNWGYDGVFPSAAQSSYGGPDGLRALVDAAHASGLAVHLDVVDNHLGPEGNVLGRYGPYFTDAYRTPWGDALNFSERDSDAVRRFFVESARWWVEDCHVDGLRLDAVHAIVDPSARPFVSELADEVRAGAALAGRQVTIVAESAANDPRLIRTPDAGGFGLDGVWSDDFHHALHVALTGERDGYYGDYDGVADLARATTDGWVYDGRHSPFRGRRHGAPARGLPGDRFVVFAQNHDQIGNRPTGDRLAASLPPEAVRVAAAAVVLAPYVPLLFMGEELGRTTPFPYFVDHGDPDLVEAVRRGRVAEFEGFAALGLAPPDPQDPETFASAIVHRDGSGPEPPGAEAMRSWYRTLLAHRRRPPFCDLEPTAVTVDVVGGDSLVVRRGGTTERPAAVVVLRFAADDAVAVPLPAGPWVVTLESGGPPDVDEQLTTDPWAVVVLERPMT